MTPITAQTVNVVNASSGNAVLDTAWMGRKSKSEPSPFWKRLAEAWSEQGLPVSQNGVAAKLGMSQGSVGRWYHAESLPEFDTCIELAVRGKVCVDWLLTGRAPKYPLSRDPVIHEIFAICDELGETGRVAVLRTARGELLQKQADDLAAEKSRQKRA